MRPVRALALAALLIGIVTGCRGEPPIQQLAPDDVRVVSTTKTGGFLEDRVHYYLLDTDAVHQRSLTQTIADHLADVGYTVVRERSEGWFAYRAQGEYEVFVGPFEAFVEEARTSSQAKSIADALPSDVPRSAVLMEIHEASTT